MANKKYKLGNGDYWETSGIYDITQNDTQRNINAAVATELAEKASKNNGVYFAECYTFGSAPNKEVTIENGPSTLEYGLTLIVKFDFEPALNSPYLLVTSTVNGTDITFDPYPIAFGSHPVSWEDGAKLVLVFMGDCWAIVSNSTVATKYDYGLTKLNDAVNSTSSSEAATPSAVKQAYDLASSVVNYVKYNNDNATELTANTTIESIITPGDYVCTTYAVASTIPDNPYPSANFRLMVFALSSTSWLQVYCPLGGSGVPMYRTKLAIGNNPKWHALGVIPFAFYLTAGSGDQTFSAIGINSQSRILSYEFTSPYGIGSTLSYTTADGSVTFNGTVYGPATIYCVFSS